MADPVLLTARPAFGPLLKPAGTGGGVTVAERTGLRLATVTALRGGDFAARFRTAFGTDPAPRPKRVVSGPLSLLGIGPRTWLAVSEEAGDLASRLRGMFGPTAAVADQSDGYAVLRVCGPKARAVFAKGLSVDLHPRAFGPGDVAATTCSHIGVTVWQVDEAPTYDLALFRSYAASFSHWLASSAEEYGLAVGEG